VITIVFQGGLGNQLYQLSLALYLRKKGYTTLLDVSNYTSNDSYHDGLSIERLIDLSEFQMIRSSGKLSIKGGIKKKIPLSLKKKLHKYKIIIDKYLYKASRIDLTEWDEDLFRKLGLNVKQYEFDIKKNYILKGYWQDEDIVNIILDDLKSMIKPITITNKDHLNLYSGITSKNSVLVHFRGGDFISKVNKEQFDILTPEYYKKAIDYYLNELENPVFYVYYDDVTQMKRLLLNPSKNTIVVGSLSIDSVYDFQFQMHHQCFICSNSTFSWWAAKLAPKRITALIPEQTRIDDENSILKVSNFKKMRSSYE
jgi:hypothetical protein